MKLAWSITPIIVICAIIIILLIAVFIYKQEGFENPLTSERMEYERLGKRFYNPLADTQDWFNIEGPIPLDGSGIKKVDDLLTTGTYESSGKKLEQGANMDIRFDTPQKYSPLPVEEYTPDVASRVRMCESVKSWDCQAFKRSDFKEFCGICVKDGKDAKGKKFKFGGLYIDPRIKYFVEEEAAKKGVEPEYTPTVGKCKAENFILERPDCDYRKDRYECSVAGSISDGPVAEKCVSCLRPPSGLPTYIYVGKRGDTETDYAQDPKPYKFDTILRLVTSYKNAKVILTRSATGETIPPTRAGLEFSYEISNTFENERFTLSVEYPSFRPYVFTRRDNELIADMVKNDTTSLSDAEKTANGSQILCDSESTRKWNTNDNDELFYGCGSITKCCKQMGRDPTRRFAIVGQFESTENKLRKQAFDTSITNINGIQVEPEQGPPRYGSVNKSATFGRLIRNSETRNIDPTMFWVWGAENTTPMATFNFVIPVTFKEPTFAEDAKICPRGALVSTEDGEGRLRAGACEKLVNGREQRPGTYTDACIRSLFLKSGCTKSGLGYPTTSAGIANLSFKMVPGKIDNLAFVNYFIKKLPDLRLIKTFEFAKDWDENYVRNAYNTAQNKKAWVETLNKMLARHDLAYPIPLVKSGTPLDIADIMSEVQTRKAEADRKYTTGMNIDKLRDDNMFCYGEFEFNPCEGPTQNTGPHTVECLDFLFKNAGKTTTGIGPTYKQSSGRSSGTDRIPSKPILYCTREGILSPIDNKGSVNMAAVQKANSQGGVSKVMAYYNLIHKKANHDINKDSQYKAMNDCYGLRYSKSGNCPKGQTALDDPTKLPEGTEFSLVPALSPGSKVINLAGALVTQSNITQDAMKATTFVSMEVKDDPNGNIYILSKSGPPKGGYLVIDGFRVKIQELQDTFDFRQRASWNVVNSVAGNPGEVSIQSVAKPGFYIYFNKLDRSINISNDPSDFGKQSCSFAAM